jgi:hypothetical protein
MSWSAPGTVSFNHLATLDKQLMKLLGLPGDETAVVSQSGCCAVLSWSAASASSPPGATSRDNTVGIAAASRIFQVA